MENFVSGDVKVTHFKSGRPISFKTLNNIQEYLSKEDIKIFDITKEKKIINIFLEPFNIEDIFTSLSKIFSEYLFTISIDSCIIDYEIIPESNMYFYNGKHKEVFPIIKYPKFNKNNLL